MRADRPSTTAAVVAAARALASQGVPVAGAADATAVGLLPRRWSEAVSFVEEAGRDGVPLRGFLRLASAGLVDHIALRTATIDAAVTDAVAEGCDQLVVLGAGLDSRAWRLDCLAEVDVFEVDHPATQGWKQHRVDGQPPRALSVVFAPIDFEQDDLATVLAAAGHRIDAPTVWVWEGVTMYLAGPAVAATLAVVAARSAPGSHLIASYMTPKVAPLGSLAARAILAGFASLGEPLVGALGTEDMAARLAQVGMSVRFDADSRQQAARLGTGSALAWVFQCERVVVASVGRAAGRGANEAR